MHPLLTLWDRDAIAARADEILDVYADAMQVPRTAAQGRRGLLMGHLDRPGLRAVAVLEDDVLVGVAYGHVGAPGQWWHDQVRAAMSDDLARTWLDQAFEVCELHVRQAHQGKSYGRALLDTLLAGTEATTAILTTPDRETRARQFYRAGGWVDLVRDLHFPGDARPFAVLGKSL